MLSVRGGRYENPFVHTDLVFDEDLMFEGVSMTGRLPFGDSGSSVFLTAGAFPLEEVELSSADKWLYGGQAGFRFGFPSGGGVIMSGAYYDYQNIEGERNDPESKLLDFTAPQFLQKGNTLFDIRNDSDANTGLFALVTDYDLVNVNLMLDTGPVFVTANQRPIHLFLVGDYVTNTGWDEEEVLARTGVLIEEKTDGYQGRIGLGSPLIRRRGDWRIDAFYRHLERDAVVDAFTDSEFHLGGTDAEGWGLEFRMGLADNTWMVLNYLSSNEIDGPPLAIDVIQLDLSARF